MSDVIERPSTAVAVTGADPYAAYGAKVGVQGQFLSFKNGEFLYGQDDKEIPLGSKLAANMVGLRIGWRRWYDAKVTDDLTVPLVDQQQPQQPRSTLGDDDQSRWETDDKGQPRDPWQLTNVLEMAGSDGENFIYSTGSKGGIGAIGRLCKEYGKLYRQHPNEVPIVELGRDSYNHPTYGKTYFPVFTIVGWTDENALTIASDGGAAAEAEPPKQVAAPAGNKKPRF